LRRPADAVKSPVSFGLRVNELPALVPRLPIPCVPD